MDWLTPLSFSVASNAAVSRPQNVAQRDSGIGPEFRLVAGTVCPGHAYGCPYTPTLWVEMQCHMITN